MIYEFQNDAGAIIERSYPMSAPPPVGHEIVVDGIVYRRIISVETMHVKVPYNGVFHSERMDSWHPLAPRHDSEGRPVFLNNNERDEFVAKTQDTKDPARVD